MKDENRSVLIHPPNQPSIISMKRDKTTRRRATSHVSVCRFFHNQSAIDRAATICVCNFPRVQWYGMIPYRQYTYLPACWLAGLGRSALHFVISKRADARQAQVQVFPLTHSLKSWISIPLEANLVTNSSLLFHQHPSLLLIGNICSICST